MEYLCVLYITLLPIKVDGLRFQQNEPDNDCQHDKDEHRHCQSACVAAPAERSDNHADAADYCKTEVHHRRCCSDIRFCR